MFSLKNRTLHFFILATLFLFGFVSVAHADTDKYVGWGWSSNIGWVAFNSQNCDLDGNNFKDTLCGGDNTTTILKAFNLKVNDTSGVMSGHAWSSSIGWISFDLADVLTCPTQPEDGGSNQARVLNINSVGARDVVGWARALKGDKGPGNVETGDWDGCIHLSSGTSGNHPTGAGHEDGDAGVTLRRELDGVTDMFVGFAWGGEVVGWLDFAPFLQKPDLPPPPPPPTPTGGGSGVGGCIFSSLGVCTGVNAGSTPELTLTVNGSSNTVTVPADSSGNVIIEVFPIPTGNPTFCDASTTRGGVIVTAYTGRKTPPFTVSEAVTLTVGSTQTVYTLSLVCDDGSNDTIDVIVNPDSGGGSTVTVVCEALNSNGIPVPPGTLVPLNVPVTWRARIVNPPANFTYNFEWHGSGFATPFTGGPVSGDTTVSRVYSTIGAKSVFVNIDGTGGSSATGSCEANPASVRVTSKPIIEPF